MSTEPTLFDLPNTPQQFGVVLEPANLRSLDFSGLDYDTSRRVMLEYIKTYYPNEFNDFIASNGLVMLLEIIASTVGKLSLRSDLLTSESFLPTALSEQAVVNHLALINQRIRRQTPAIVDIECTVDRPLNSTVNIPAGTTFQVTGPDQEAIYYEIYRAPNDWSSDIVIPPAKRGVIAWGIEGRFASVVRQTSTGGARQQYSITDSNILESPIFVSVESSGTVDNWTVIYEPIEKYGPTDKVVEVVFYDNQATFVFGDNITGAIPPSGSSITFRYRVGGGRRGRIGVNIINTQRTILPTTGSTVGNTVTFRNITASSGGTDKETIEEAKKRAPREFATQKSIVTASDYAEASENFSHPVFGIISKAVATLKSNINTNLVEVYVLAVGNDDAPTTPSAGLKEALRTHLDELNVLTDSVEVLDGSIFSVDLEYNIVVHRNADASFVKEQVESSIADYFKLSNWSMGEPFYLSNFVEAIEKIDGVKYMDLFAPANNILASNALAIDSPATTIGINQVISLGSRKSAYYYE